MRYGKFFLDDVLLRTYGGQRIVAEVFSAMRFVPTRVEHLFHCDKFECLGFSNMFLETKQGAMAPEYEVKIVVENDLLLDFSVDLKKQGQ